MFTLATWNINSVRLREPIVLKLLQEEAPDVLCLQECKSPVEKIPKDGFAALGYTHMVARGQKGYNGVAILSKLPMIEAGAEDFAYMLQVRPGSYLFLGAGEGHGLHHPQYDYNDEISPIGASFLARLVEVAQPVAR